MKQLYLYFCLVIALSAALTFRSHIYPKKNEDPAKIQLQSMDKLTNIVLKEGDHISVSLLNGEIIVERISPSSGLETTLGDLKTITNSLKKHIPYYKPNGKRNKIGIYTSVASDFDSEVNIYFRNPTKATGRGEVYFMVDFKYFPILESKLAKKELQSKKDLFNLAIDVLKDPSIKNVEYVVQTDGMDFNYGWTIIRISDDSVSMDKEAIIQTLSQRVDEKDTDFPWN